MTAGVVVGVDFGSSRVKAAAYGPDGVAVAAAQRPTPTEAVRGGGTDFPVLAVLDAAADAVRELALPAGAVRAVGISSMGEVGTVLDDDGLADVAFPSWYDARGSEVVAELEAAFGAEWLARRTGNHTRVASTVAKLGHLARTQPVPAGTFLGLAGAFAWQLTGRAWQEGGLAVTSGVYDPVARAYLLDVWAAAGLSDVGLPAVAPAGAGRPATTSLADHLCLAAGAPVVIAGHDHPVAAVGAGVRTDEVADSMGTGEALLATMRADLATDEAHRQATLDADPLLTFELWPATGDLLVVWERLRPGLAMQTFLDAHGLDRTLLDAEAPPPRPTRLEQDVVSALEDAGPTSLPPTAESWAALIDHYVVAANHGQELLRRATGAAGATVLTGGGLRSPRWRHAKAALGTGPMAVSLAQETACRGAAAIAGASAGWWPDAESMPGAGRVDLPPMPVAAMRAVDHASAVLGW